MNALAVQHLQVCCFSFFTRVSLTEQFLGGCKHGVAFLFWLHRRSEEPSVTSVESYWKAPTLSQAGRSLKYMTLQKLTQRTVPSIRQKSEVFLKKVLEGVNVAESGLFEVFCTAKNENTSVWHLYLKYKDSVDRSLRSADDFIAFMKNEMRTTECQNVEVLTRAQAKSQEWFDLRFGRITASKIYEASRCKTAEGALTEAILGASAFKGTEASKRGQKLEPQVIAEVAKARNIKIISSGLLLNPGFPIFGASPDGISDNYVVEVKCPSKEETVRQYIENEKLKPKYYAQIQIQMFFANKQKGLFCVASPHFENNSVVSIYDVNFDIEACNDLFHASEMFWKNVIFSLLNK